MQPHLCLWLGRDMVPFLDSNNASCPVGNPSPIDIFKSPSTLISKAGDGLVDEVDPTEVEWEGESSCEDDDATDPTRVILPALFGVGFVVCPVTDAVKAAASRFL